MINITQGIGACALLAYCFLFPLTPSHLFATIPLWNIVLQGDEHAEKSINNQRWPNNQHIFGELRRPCTFHNQISSFLSNLILLIQVLYLIFDLHCIMIMLGKETITFQKGPSKIKLFAFHIMIASIFSISVY